MRHYVKLFFVTLISVSADTCASVFATNCLNSISTKYTVFARCMSSILDTAISFDRNLQVFQAMQSTEALFNNADVAKQIVAQKTEIPLSLSGENLWKGGSSKLSLFCTPSNSDSEVLTHSREQHSLPFWGLNRLKINVGINIILGFKNC